MPSRSRSLTTAFIAVLVAALGGLAGNAGAAPSSQRYIVVLEDDARPSKVADAHRAKFGLKIGHVYRSALRGYSAKVPPGMLRKIESDVRVDYVVQDALVTGTDAKGTPNEFGVSHIPENSLPPQASPNAEPPAPPFTGEQPGAGGGGGSEEDIVEGAGNPSGGGGGGATTGQKLPTGIDRIDGDLSSATSGNGSGSLSVGVAVLDTGSGPHSDLNVAGGFNCVPRTKGTTDLQGHGTHIAGIIGAKDDGAGVVGVAPGARIYSVRVLGTSITGTLSDLVCGLDWVAANATAQGINVVNLSLELSRTVGDAGMDDDCDGPIGDALHDAVCRLIAKGVTIVAAAGNYTKEMSKTIPAAYNDVLAVSAMADFDGKPGGLGVNPRQCEADGDDSSAAFSNWASDSGSDKYHTVAGPGRCLESTWKGGGYNLQSGTSFAAPHVTGVVALCVASGQCAGLSPRSVVERIYGDANNTLGSFGFTDDPNSAISGRWYGRLVSAAPY